MKKSGTRRPAATPAAPATPCSPSRDSVEPVITPQRDEIPPQILTHLSHLRQITTPQLQHQLLIHRRRRREQETLAHRPEHPMTQLTRRNRLHRSLHSTRNRTATR